MDIKKPLVAILAAASLGTVNAGEIKELDTVLALTESLSSYGDYKPKIDQICSAYQKRNGVINRRDLKPIEDVQYSLDFFDGGLDISIKPDESNPQALVFVYKCKKN